MSYDVPSKTQCDGVALDQKKTNSGFQLQQEHCSVGVRGSAMWLLKSTYDGVQWASSAVVHEAGSSCNLGGMGLAYLQKEFYTLGRHT